MRWHTESIYIILSTDLLKFERVVALMAVKYQQLVYAYSTPCYMLNKVL